MKKNYKKIIGIILIALGIVLIGSVVYKKIQTKAEQNKLIQIFEQEIQEGSTNNEDINKTEDEINSKAMALIEIPKIDVKAGVVEGVEQSILKYNLGHFPGTARAGERGNFAVAGHRIFPYAENFKHLDKLEIGDEIKVKDKASKEYIYTVTEKFIVEPTRVDVLDSTDEATMTLVTCTIGGKERLIIKGKLKE